MGITFSKRPSFAALRDPFVIVLLLVPLLPLWHCFAYGQSIGAFDQIHQMTPWNGPKPAQPWDVLQADSVLQFFPWRDLVFDAWGKGQLPLWNPYELAGTPLLANSQSAGFYPLHILFGLLHTPTGLAIALLAWIHLALAGWGTFRLVTRMRGSKFGGLVAGISFSLSPFMLAWTALPSVISTVCWIPWILSSIETLRTATSGRIQAKAAVGVALTTGMMVLAGHLQFVAYGMMAAVLWTLPRPRLDEGRFSLRSIPISLGALALGLLLAGPQLFPVLSYSKFSHRQNSPSEDGYQAYVASAVRPTDLAARLVHPLGQGDPTQFAAEGTQVSQFWPSLSRQGANFAESAITIGPTVFILAGLGLRRRELIRRAFPAAIVALLSLLLALGTPLNRLLYFGVPGWSASGSPGRIEVLFVFAACVLAGLGLPQEKLERREAGKWVGVAALLAICTMVPIVDKVPQGVPADAWSVIAGSAAGQAPRFLLSVVLSAGALWLGLTRRMPIFAALALAAIVPPCTTYALNLVRTGDPSFLQTPPKGVLVDERIAVVNDNWSLITAPAAIAPPNTLSVARVHELSGYDSLLHRDTVALLHDIDGQDPAPPANGNMMFVKSTADAGKLADAGVTQVWSRKPLGPAFGPPETHDGYLSYSLRGPGRLGGRDAGFLRDDYGTLEIATDPPGRTIIAKERWMPGWTHAAPEGPWRRFTRIGKRVAMSYVPPGFWNGVISAAVGWLVVLVVLFLSRSKGPAPDSGDEPLSQTV